MTAAADRLRTIADYLDSHPDLPVPSVVDGAVTWHLDREPDWRDVAAGIMRDLGGTWHTQPITDFVAVKADVEGWGEVSLFVPRWGTDRPEVDLRDLPGIT